MLDDVFLSFRILGSLLTFMMLRPHRRAASDPHRDTLQKLKKKMY